MDEKGVSAHYVPMKHIYSQFVAAIALSFAVSVGAACAQQGTPEAQDGQTEGEHWLDRPQTPGDWSYVDEPSESLALFGDANPVHLFVLRCDKETQQIGIARRGESDGDLLLLVRTETAERTLTASKVPDYGLVAASLPASDPLLDAMAITKGRFAVEVEGMEPLYIPAWAEVTRVIEDCR